MIDLLYNRLRYVRGFDYQARARAKPERAACIHMLWRGFLPIFSEVSGLIWFEIVGKSSEGVGEGQVCENFFIGQEIRKFA